MSTSRPPDWLASVRLCRCRALAAPQSTSARKISPRLLKACFPTPKATPGCEYCLPITITNNGSATVNQGAAELVGRNPSSFQIVSNTCTNAPLVAGASCTIRVRHTRSAGDSALEFANLEWTSTDAIRPLPSFGLVGSQ